MRLSSSERGAGPVEISGVGEVSLMLSRET